MDYEGQRAFTLVELLIALAILVVVISLATPSMTQLYRKQQLGLYQDDLMRLIVQARQHALVNRNRVTLCALNGQGRCVSLKTGELTTFVDANGNRVLDADEVPLRTLSVPAYIRADWRGMQPIHSLHFNWHGTTHLSNGTFTLCHRSGPDHHGTLTVNPQGRVRSERHPQSCPLG